MKNYKIGQIVQYSGLGWKIHSIIWIKDFKGKTKKLRLVTPNTPIDVSWYNIPYVSTHYCEISINNLD